MFKFFLGGLGLFLFLGNSYAQAKRFMISSEYKQDNLYYNEKKKSFYRNKIHLFFSQKSGFNFAHLYVKDPKRKVFTWNLFFKDFYPKSEIYFGNFYTNFGSGLFLGQKRFSSPNLFQASLKNNYSKTFTLANNGDPLFSFQGLAFIHGRKFGDTFWALKGFSSFKERYREELKEDSSFVNYSFNSVNSQDEKQSGKNDLAKINDHGLVLEIVWKELLTSQVYTKISYLTDYQGESLFWDYKKNNTFNRGVKNSFGYGFFSQYKDENISFFFDLCFLRRKILGEDNQIFYSLGRGFSSGFKFKNPIFVCSLQWEETNHNFLPLYKTENPRPSRICDFSLSFRPKKKLFLGGGAFLKKDNLAGTNNDSLKNIKKESCWLKYETRKIIFQPFSLARVEADEGLGEEESFKLKSSLKYNKKKFFKANIFSIFQSDQEKNLSFCLGGGSSFIIFSKVVASLYYSYFKITGQNKIYASISPSRNYIGNGSFYSQTSSLVVGKIDFKYNYQVLSIRAASQFTLKKTVKRRIDLQGTLVF